MINFRRWRLNFYKPDNKQISKSDFTKVNWFIAGSVASWKRIFFTFLQLIERNVHLGTDYRNILNSATWVIYGLRLRMAIINILHSVFNLRRSVRVVTITARYRRRILFVNTNKSFARSLVDSAVKIGEPYVSGRWPGGVLTNFKGIWLRARLMLTHFMLNGTLSTSKRSLFFSLKGLTGINALPAAVFISSAYRDTLARHECGSKQMAAFGLVDTDSLAPELMFLIPSNDDAYTTHYFYSSMFCKSILISKMKFFVTNKFEKVRAENAYKKRFSDTYKTTFDWRHRFKRNMYSAFKKKTRRYRYGFSKPALFGARPRFKGFSPVRVRLYCSYV